MEVQLEDTLNRQWKDDKTGFGYRMLQKMGWKEDKGLGKNETGMSAAVKVKRREVGLGLGVNKDEAGNSGWGTTVSSFNAVLDLLNTSYGTSHKTKTKKKKVENIQVRIKYGKIAAAKDLKNKTSKELAAVLGHTSTFSTDSNVDKEEISEKPAKKKKRSREESSSEDSINDSVKKEKTKKRKKDKSENSSSKSEKKKKKSKSE